MPVPSEPRPCLPHALARAETFSETEPLELQLLDKFDNCFLRPAKEREEVQIGLKLLGLEHISRLREKVPLSSRLPS